MTKFAHYKQKHDINGETLREFVFGDLEGEPSVWVAPATDVNPEFLNERVRIAIERAESAPGTPRGKRTPAITSDGIEADREADRVLLSRTCAKKWGTPPVDQDGQPVEFNEANCYEFFKELPIWIFDPLRGFASNIYNFAPSTHVTEASAEAMGNS